ncbi:MAG: putative lipopolysaccharide heptosyltransferase III [Verrucomicrobiota bacterium]|nr:putative lipopolysaccharide heptosyltransferase III [Verrucomicrobiota bacterium]
MNILLIQLKRIGDLVLTTPAIAAVRQHFPSARISLVVAAGSRELLPAIAGIDRTFIARGKISDAASWFGVARRKYDYCVDFTHSDRSAFLAVLSGARKRISFGHAELQSQVRALTYNVLVNAPLRSLHTVDYHLALLAPLGIHDAPPEVRLQLPPDADEQAARALAQAHIHSDFVLLHPGSARIEKFWEPERWSRLVDWAARRGLACVVTGGTAELEQTHLAAIKAQAQIQSPLVDLSGKLSLLALAALIRRARLLVTVDSAPAHLAAAMQTPQVVLFGPTNPLHWRPRFSPAVILQAGNAEPVTEFSPNQKRVPMNQISTGQVIRGMEAVLAAPRE